MNFRLLFQTLFSHPLTPLIFFSIFNHFNLSSILPILSLPHILPKQHKPISPSHSQPASIPSCSSFTKVLNSLGWWFIVLVPCRMSFLHRRLYNTQHHIVHILSNGCSDHPTHSSSATPGQTPKEIRKERERKKKNGKQDCVKRAS